MHLWCGWRSNVAATHGQPQQHAFQATDRRTNRQTDGRCCCINPSLLWRGLYAAILSNMAWQTNWILVEKCQPKPQQIKKLYYYNFAAGGWEDNLMHSILTASAYIMAVLGPWQTNKMTDLTLNKNDSRLARRSGTHWQMNCVLTLVIGLN